MARADRGKLRGRASIEVRVIPVALGCEGKGGPRLTGDCARWHKHVADCTELPHVCQLRTGSALLEPHSGKRPPTNAPSHIEEGWSQYGTTNAIRIMLGSRFSRYMCLLLSQAISTYMAWWAIKAAHLHTHACTNTWRAYPEIHGN